MLIFDFLSNPWALKTKFLEEYQKIDSKYKNGLKMSEVHLQSIFIANNHLNFIAVLLSEKLEIRFSPKVFCQA